MMKTLFRHVLGFGPSRKRLFEKLEESQKEAANANEFLNGYEGFMDRIDDQISESLEKIGELPGKPAGFPDRVDVACRLLKSIAGLKKEIAGQEQSIDGLRFDLNERDAKIAGLRLDILAKDEAIRILENNQKIADLRYQM